MKRSWLLAGVLTLGAFLLWVILGRRDRHPDTSSVASYAPYMEFRGDIAPSWAPDDKQIIYSRGGPEGQDLYVVPANGGTARLFLNGDAGLPVWSPDGMRVAFSSSRSGKFKLMRALGFMRPVNLWTASASGSDLRQLTDSSASFLDASWSPDGTLIAFTAYPGPRVMTVSASGSEAKFFADGFSPTWSRDGKRMAYFSGDPAQPGSGVSIFVQPAAGGAARHLNCFMIKPDYFFRPTLDWSPDGKRLLTTQLTDGQWQPVVIDENEDKIASTLPITGSAIYPRWSHDGQRIAYGLTDTGHPPSIEVFALQSRQSTQLTRGSGGTIAQLVRYPGGGGLEIPGWLYLPRDSGLAKHPALIWLHGGAPGLGSMRNEFEPKIQYFVDQGFVVFAPDYRGSAGFGDKLATVHQGDEIVPDIAASVAYLKELKLVDASQIGVIGFSFGGYLTLQTITQQPELFTAAVDFSGLSDLARVYKDAPLMRPMLTQLLGGTPDEKPEVYRAFSPLNFVDRIKIPLLILHGTSDESASYSHAVELAKALQQAHKSYEFISYRSAGHRFFGKDEIDANQQVLRFLKSHLKASRIPGE
jgi:dipeptidyl aminopeptidase/acylaminoacyl peptidase